MIEFQNVSKAYAGNQEDVVKNLNLTIPDGKIVVLIGPSGCGKTTSLKMINRLISISQGKILIDGKDNMEYDPIELRRSMGYVIQQTGLFPHMTIRENIEIIPVLQKKDPQQIEERTIQLMKMVGLDEEFLQRYPTQLSGGQLQRVGVARAFALDPQIILMDEPFSALDPITRNQLQDELLYLQTRLRKTIVFVTHDMDEAVKLADLICIMKNGRIVQYGTPEEIMKAPADEFVANFVGKNRIWSNPQYILAKDIMLTDPFVVPEELSCLKTIEQMRRNHVNSAMVIDENHKLVGVALARDIQNATDRSVAVKEVAAFPKITTGENANILDLLKMVNESKVSTIPVLSDNNRLLGLITSSSLVTSLSQQYIDFQEVNG